MKIIFQWLFLFALGVVTAGDALAQKNPPNIVLLVADDLGYSDIGAFGSEIHTPNIDSLARQGVRFSNFHVTASCAPTRATLLTGVDHHRAGIGNMRETVPLRHRWKPGYEGVLNDRVITVSSRLQKAGYQTMVAGKWHLGHATHNLPPARGFDHSVIQADSGSDNFEMRTYLPMQDDIYWYEDGERMASLPDDFYSSTYFIDKTIEYIELGRANKVPNPKPFFAYVAFQANHSPLQAPQQYINKYLERYEAGWHELRKERAQKVKEIGLIPIQANVAKDGNISVPEWHSLSVEQQRYEKKRMAVYAGMAEAMDNEIGRLVSYLRDIDELDNTVFVFLSDNGAAASDPYNSAFARRWLETRYVRDVESLGQKGSWISLGENWNIAANSPLSLHKFFAGEGGLRTPMIISGVGGQMKNTIHDSFVRVADITPTLLSLAGVSYAGAGADIEPVVGKNLTPVLLGLSERVYGKDEAVGYELSGNAAVYKDGYKLVKNLPPAGDGQWHLYSMLADPGETTDLRKDLPQRFQQMLGDYQDYAVRNRVQPMPDGYFYINQVMINTVLFILLPRWLPFILAGSFMLWILLRIRRFKKVTHRIKKRWIN